MFTRDAYVALLEKRATDTESSVEPNDSAEATAMEYRKNLEDNRQYLHGIFPNAGEVQANQSATIKKLFDNLPSGTIVGTPLLKVARAVFFEAISQGHVKTASPIHAELSYRAFCDELEKIANLGAMGAGGGMAAPPAQAATQGMKAPMSAGAAGGGGMAAGGMGKVAALKQQTLAQVAAKNRVAMSRPAKAWDISSPASAGAAGARPSAPQGSGTSVNQGGFLSRLLGR